MLNSHLAVPVASIGFTPVLICVAIAISLLTGYCVVWYATGTSATTLSFVPPKQCSVIIAISVHNYKLRYCLTNN